MDKIIIAYKDGDVYRTQEIFTDLPDGSSVSFDVSYDKVLITDGTNPCRFISIDKEKNLEYGEIGIDAPYFIPEQDTSGESNSRVAWNSADIGMGVESGNILQYAVTVEDVYGTESNPSPIGTFDKMIYKFPTDTSNESTASDLGFDYYLYKTVVTGLRVNQYTKNVIDKLKTYNIYRRDILFKEGVIGKQFNLVYRKAINKNSENQQYTDTSNSALGEITYDKGKSPSGTSIVKTGNVIFVGGITSDIATFPFKWQQYSEITITNDNDTDYVNAVIALSINSETDVELPANHTWQSYADNPDKIRLFHSDLTTPCPVIFKIDDSTMYIYAKIPQLDRNTSNKIYLVLADVGNEQQGITDNAWRSQLYGQFKNINDYDYNTQRVFDINRVRNANVKISSSVIYTSQPTNQVLNWADMNMDSNVYEDDNPSTQSNWVLQNYNTNATIFGSDVSYYGKAMRFVDKHVNYILTDTLTNKFLAVIDLYTDGYGGTNNLFKIKNPSASTPVIQVDYQFEYRRLRIQSGNTIHYIDSLPVNQYLTNIRLALYMKDSQIFYKLVCRLDNGTVFERNNTQPLIVDTKPNMDNANVYLFYNTTGSEIRDNTLNKFELYDDIEYSQAEFENLSLQYLYNTPLFIERVANNPHKPVGEWLNNNVSFENKTFNNDNLKNKVVWSDINGQYFNVLNYKNMDEEVLALIKAPSFLKMQYQNTLVIFTRNTVSRLPLSDDLNTMASRSDNLVSEYQSGGLYAKNSVLVISDAIFWFSENGVMMWTANGMQNISANIIDIPLFTEYIGLYIPSRNQYWLHNNTEHITYVYHINTGVWTTFSGLNIKGYANLNSGTDTDCKSMFLQDDDMFTTYPSNQYDNVEYTLTTKQYVLDYAKPFRYRGVWSKESNPDGITAITYNSKFVGYDQDILSTETSPKRFDWVYLPNGFWGEYIQFTFDNVEALTRLDIDIKDGV